MTKKERMYEKIREHGENLKKIFSLDTDPIELSKKLRRLEVKMHAMTTKCCNESVPEEEQDKVYDSVIKSLEKLLHFSKKGIPVFVNWDPRGYALKIKEDYIQENKITIEKDWGGYGLLAPDFNLD
jgi:hypothetical protein